MSTSSIERLTAHNALARLAQQDATLFAPHSTPEHQAIAQRLGWVTLAGDADASLEHLELLSAEAVSRGITDVLLLGMGGSSLAAYVLGNVLGSEEGPTLHVLDTTSPDEIADHVRMIDFETTYTIVASKSGTTLEPIVLGDLFFEIACEQLGSVEAAARNFIAITDPGTKLAQSAAAQGWRHVILGDVTVGGRFSALSLFGLVPAALIGLDVERLLSSAYRMEVACTGEESYANPAAQLACFMGDGYLEGRDKLIIVLPKEYRPFGLWLSQLVGESLGKDGLGLVPIVSTAHRQGVQVHDDQLVIVMRDDHDEELAEYAEAIEKLGPVMEFVVANPHELGAEFVRWEFAVALAGLLFGVNPFDEPDVARAKQATKDYLAGELQVPTLPSLASLEEAITPKSYIALLAYVNRTAEVRAELGNLAFALSEKYQVPVSIEYGPRYLHSTGQLHKGGPDQGVFIVIGDDDENGLNLLVPHYEFTLRELFNAQRYGDIASLVASNRAVFMAPSIEAVYANL